MKTIKNTSGYERLVPETKLEQGLLEIAIKAALDGRELQTAEFEHQGEIKVLDRWADGRLACRATFVTPNGDDSTFGLLNHTKSLEFTAWVEDHGNPVVAWEARSGERKTSNIAPYLPMILAADLV